MTRNNLLEILAAISRQESAQIQDSTSLNMLLSGSLGRAKLDAALRSKFSITEPRLYQVTTVGELCVLLGLSGEASTVAIATQKAPTTTVVQALPGGTQLGVDIESISDLPQVLDYWEDAFYKAIFTPAEIAYAVLQTSPRVSFAAIWCAKEALRKADVAFSTLDWQRIAVVHDVLGKPSIEVDDCPLGGALSLSHSRDYAIAVYSALAPAESAQRAHISVVTPAPVAEDSSAPHRGGGLAAGMSLLAFLLSIAALLSNFLLHR